MITTTIAIPPKRAYLTKEFSSGLEACRVVLHLLGDPAQVKLASILQVLEHPSLSTTLPSSQVSFISFSTTPLPQTCLVALVDVLLAVVLVSL